MGAAHRNHVIGADAQPLWTVERANARLDELRELLPQMEGWVTRLRRIYEELRRLAKFWGTEAEASDNPDRDLKGRLETEWRLLSSRLEERVETLRTEGIEVKDLESGLVDFYALRAGEVVYLCWQRGEDSVRFYHTLTGGYSNRRPIESVTTDTPASPRGRH
ncbi:MAG: DUF2203 domain-containing protein [Thermoplasmata archaeon]